MRPSLAVDLLDLLLPRGCLGCGDRIPPEETQGMVCGRCRTLLRAPPSPLCPRCGLPLGTGHPSGEACQECVRWPTCLASARAAVILEAPSGALVHALKYGGWRDLAPLMGDRMARVELPAGPEALVVPVPTTPGRRRMRGYNQAALLAVEVAGRRGARCLEALERPGGRSQVHLGPRAREANIRGSFRVIPALGSRIAGREVILVDDVLTTGATARSAAGTLARAGVERVHLLTFARALPFGEGGWGGTGR